LSPLADRRHFRRCLCPASPLVTHDAPPESARPPRTEV